MSPIPSVLEAVHLEYKSSSRSRQDYVSGRPWFEFKCVRRLAVCCHQRQPRDHAVPLVTSALHLLHCAGHVADELFAPRAAADGEELKHVFLDIAVKISTIYLPH